MTATRNMNRSMSRELRSRVRRQEVATTMNSASITQPGGRFRVGAPGSGGFLRADGTLEWSGLINFIGELMQTGPSTFDGPVQITLTLDVDGNTTIAGNTTITGELDVTAQTQLRALTKILADLSVESGGKIKVGTFELRPASSGGAEIVSPVDIKVTTPLLDVGGSVKVDQGIVASHLPPAPPGAAANLYIDADGAIRRVL